MKKLLIIVDMQNDFIDGSLANKDAQDIIPNMVKYINDFSGDIAITLDTHNLDYMSTQEGRLLPIPHCIKGSEGHKLNSSIATAIEGRTKYTLTKYGFGYTEYSSLNLDKIYDEVILVGTCTDICVISNALAIKQAYPELKVSVISSLCAGVNKDLHDSALKVMKSCQINVL